MTSESINCVIKTQASPCCPMYVLLQVSLSSGCSVQHLIGSTKKKIRSARVEKEGTRSLSVMNLERRLSGRLAILDREKSRNLKTVKIKAKRPQLSNISFLIIRDWISNTTMDNTSRPKTILCHSVSFLGAKKKLPKMAKNARGCASKRGRSASKVASSSLRCKQPCKTGSPREAHKHNTA